MKEHVSVSGITLNKEATSIVKGATETLVATVTPPDAENKAVTWASDKPAVAKVDQNGKVTAVDGGTANITATTVDGKKVATCVVTVTVPVTGVTFDHTTLSLAVGEEATVTATVAPANATNKEVLFSITEGSDNVLLTGTGGQVRGLKAGETTLVGKTKDGDFTATCKITVTEPEA